MNKPPLAKRRRSFGLRRRGVLPGFGLTLKTPDPAEFRLTR